MATKASKDLPLDRRTSGIGVSSAAQTRNQGPCALAQGTRPLRGVQVGSECPHRHADQRVWGQGPPLEPAPPCPRPCQRPTLALPLPPPQPSPLGPPLDGRRRSGLGVSAARRWPPSPRETHLPPAQTPPRPPPVTGSERKLH